MSSVEDVFGPEAGMALPRSVQSMSLRLLVDWRRYVLPGMEFHEIVTVLVADWTALRLSGSRTASVKMRMALSGGEPLSVTRKARELTLGACAGVGVQEKWPLVVTLAPAGGTPARE